MKKMNYLIGVVSALLFTLGPFSTGFCQADRCIILEKNDNTALVSCDDGTTRNTDLSGRSDQYKAGDSISVPKTSDSGSKEPGTLRNPSFSSVGAPPARAR